jgi:hypothetical protein
MKYNLKNRPNWTYYPGFQTYREAVMEWFEGFEQELRERLTDRHECLDLIKEILGK